jgi:hypothetical protein
VTTEVGQECIPYPSRPTLRRTKRCSRLPPASAPASLPLPGACDQEVNERTDVAPHKVHEEVSKQETRHHFEPRDVRVSLPRRADESSAVRSSGNHVPTSASLDAEVDEGRPVRWNAREASSYNLVQATGPKRLRGHDHKGRGQDHLTRLGVTTSERPPGYRLPPDRPTCFCINHWVSPLLPTSVVSRPQGRGTEQRGEEDGQSARRPVIERRGPPRRRDPTRKGADFRGVLTGEQSRNVRIFGDVRR